jgi:hypothetical protein
MEDTEFNWKAAIAAATALKSEQGKAFERLLVRYVDAGEAFKVASEAGETTRAIAEACSISTRDVSWATFLSDWTVESLKAFAADTKATRLDGTKHAIVGITNLVTELKGKRSDGPDYIKSATKAYEHMTKAQRKVFLRSIGLDEATIATVLASK